MAIHRDNILWWKVIRRKFHKSSSHHQNSNSSSSIIVLHNNDGPFSSEGFNSGANSDNGVSEFMEESREGVAAISIQACFRRHLALRAYKALKSLVKLQALVRGVLVRRQARIALSCMNALARLQITVRSRQLLNARHY